MASALQLKLRTGKTTATKLTPGTTDLKSYEAYLHARYFSYMNDKESATKALDYVNRAIQFDPNYAPAYALRASITLQSGGMAWVNPSKAAETTRRDTEKSIVLDPNLADGYQVLSWSSIAARRRSHSKERASSRREIPKTCAAAQCLRRARAARRKR